MKHSAFRSGGGSTARVKCKAALAWHLFACGRGLSATGVTLALLSSDPLPTCLQGARGVGTPDPIKSNSYGWLEAVTVRACMRG